jgi:hypothetical protein
MDGVYCQSKILPGTEGDLGTPLDLPFQPLLTASVVFNAVGVSANVGSWVVGQTDLSDGNWVDAVWASWNGTTGSALFSLYNLTDATAGCFVQTRAAGAPPSVYGASGIPLASRLRFVGRGQITASGPGSGLLVTIKYRLISRLG